MAVVTDYAKPLSELKQTPATVTPDCDRLGTRGSDRISHSLKVSYHFFCVSVQDLHSAHLYSYHLFVFFVLTLTDSFASSFVIILAFTSLYLAIRTRFICVLSKSVWLTVVYLRISHIRGRNGYFPPGYGNIGILSGIISTPLGLYLP